MEARVRLVVGLLLVAALVALSVPLMIALADRRTTALTAERDRQLRALAGVAASGEDPVSAVARYHAVYGEAVLITDADGRLIATAGGLDAADPEVADAVRVGLIGQPAPPMDRVVPWTRVAPLRMATASERGEVEAVALVRVDVSSAAADVARGWAAVLVVAVTLLAAAALLTRWLSRWAVRPVHSLEAAAQALARGDRRDAVLATGPPELRELVREFNRMTEVVQRSLDEQRRLVADASHQLRNPLAAVRLRADAVRGHLRESGARTHDALTGELERLERLLDQLLHLARVQETATSRHAGAGPVEVLAPLDEVVGDRVEAWSVVADQRSQRLCVGDDAAAPSTTVPREDLEQVLDVMLDNATRYAGPGASIVVRTRAEQGAALSALVIAVEDDGPGLPDGGWGRATDRFWRGDAEQPGSGLGLAIASELVRARGGQLTLRPGPCGGTVAEVRVTVPAEHRTGRGAS